MSFNVLATARPVRTAFLLNEAAGFDAVCDGLTNWSNQFWGGRQSAIGLVEKDGTLTVETLQELARFDPDHVYSFVPLSDELLGKLDEELSPWFIREPKDTDRLGQESTSEQGHQVSNTTQNSAQWVEESIETPGISVPPTEQNLAAFQNRPLLLFNFGKDCPALVRRFLHRNLGTYYQWFDPRTGEVRRIAWMENLLARVPTERLSVSDLPSLCGAMEKLAGTPPGRDCKRPLSFTSPSELSGIHLGRHYMARGAFDHSYRVVVGSHPRDFLLYWRSCLNEGHGVWDVPFRHCLWVPAELIREEPFVAALKNWLYCFTGQGSSGSLSVELTSVSLSAEQLSPLVDAWRTGGFCMHTRLVTAADLETRWRAERARDDDPPHFIPLLNGNNSQQFESVERTRTFELRPPEVIQAEVASGTWALDVQIAREPREGGLPGQDWWVLPRRSGRALVTSMFGTHARISRCGLFAVQIERAFKWPDTLTTPHLALHLPPDDQVLAALVVNSRPPWFDYSDARRDRLQFKPVVTGMGISDAGRKLRGLIELFGGFWRARDYWERTFWREMFCRMARRGTRYDPNVRIETEQVIQKELKKAGISLSQDVSQQIAQKITHRMINQVASRFRDSPMSFAEMEEVRGQIEEAFKIDESAAGTKEVKYLAGDTMVHMMRVTPVAREEFEEGLGELVQLGVFRMGLEVCCPRCLLQHWIDADALRRSQSCSGCSSPMTLVPETEWSYRLNPLVHHCINHRVLAVWHAFSELSHRLGSFFFTPSSELHFARPVNGKSKSEVDVLCVTDGELLLGEVKTGGLHEQDFLDFAAIAAAIRPDRAAVFVESEQFDAKARKWFDNFERQLEPLGVQGQLFCLTNY